MKQEATESAPEPAPHSGTDTGAEGQNPRASARGASQVQPTVIRDVPWNSELAQEEVFGPVLAVVDADGFDDAIRIANSVKYGMSAPEGRDREEPRREVPAGAPHCFRPGSPRRSSSAWRQASDSPSSPSMPWWTTYAPGP
ncbi:aldehyde dehydrogenase family protein [Streptomyces sp. NPDC014889]|uniref:aldehyde dehydrogenase family protein n=1 Tax=Streptomyces sp. NPDC014889 TaxID=3364928 RepID=UPI0036F8B8CB